MKSFIIMAFFSSLIAPAALAQTPSKAEVFVLCKINSNVRTIAIQKKGEGYITIYSKFGNPKEVGRGYSLESNRRILENIKTNLEKSHFNCREVKAASVVQAEGGE